MDELRDEHVLCVVVDYTDPRRTAGLSVVDADPRFPDFVAATYLNAAARTGDPDKLSFAAVLRQVAAMWNGLNADQRALAHSRALGL